MNVGLLLKHVHVMFNLCSINNQFTLNYLCRHVFLLNLFSLFSFLEHVASMHVVYMDHYRSIYGGVGFCRLHWSFRNTRIAASIFHDVHLQALRFLAVLSCHVA